MKKDVLLYEGGEEPKRSLLEKVNDSLNRDTPEGADPIMVQDIASHLGVDLDTLANWVERDDEFKKGLEKYNEIQASGIFKDDEFGNRADAMVIALLLLETKKRYTV